ncbi:MAG: hypothetical protein JWN70_3179, partial [Planctomycetaceae bacterium]|nr:hypothetical protein [Planctomycetaceae bacterium]
MRRWILLSLTLACTGPGLLLAADQPAIDVGTPTELLVEPAKFELNGSRAQQQIIVTGKYANGEMRDLTSVAVFTSSADAISKIDRSLVKPVADGSAQITATVGALKAVAEATIKNMAQPTPVSFKNQTIAA